MRLIGARHESHNRISLVSCSRTGQLLASLPVRRTKSFLPTTGSPVLGTLTTKVETDSPQAWSGYNTRNFDFRTYKGRQQYAKTAELLGFSRRSRRRNREFQT
jgi:hypothetical protein